jgi:hypothetical protein
MKTLKHALSTVLLACCVAAQTLFGAREIVCNVSGNTGTTETGIITRICETAAITLRYALVQTGTAPGSQFIVNTAATLPLGVVMDEPAVGDSAAIQLLGSKSGTMKMVASGVITAGALVYTDAAGKVSATAAAGSYHVGRALTAAGADGDLIEVLHCFPMAVSTPTVANATADRTVTAAEANGEIFVSNLGASGAVTFALPAATVGMRVSAVVRAAQELRLDPNGSETIALPSSGVQGAAGKYLTADAVGENVELICLTAATWDAVGSTGTWTAQG